ncbi:MAG TPA: hypothetical protein VGM90_02455 [Kofleriaceae bacterium]|jgi:hypothetical protein
MDSGNGTAPDTALAQPVVPVPSEALSIRRRDRVLAALRRPLVRFALQLLVVFAVTLACYVLGR